MQKHKLLSSRILQISSRQAMMLCGAAVFCIFAFFSPCRTSAVDLTTELKENARQIFCNISHGASAKELGKLPEGFCLIEGPMYRGFSIEQGKLEIRVHTWAEDSGLLENYFAAEETGMSIIAAVNGTFYSSRGALGSVVSDAALPTNIIQTPGALSRCFVASFRGDKKRQRWYLGETPNSGGDLIRLDFKREGWFNIVGELCASYLDQLLGGGGWILRERKDVHSEAFGRQRFRFRKEDLTSRKTVIAQDTDRRLYFLVFETGQTFHQVARTFVKDPVFAKVREAIFLDGGSSSAIVIKGKYFVPPLYLFDKARFTCIQILVPNVTW